MKVPVELNLLRTVISMLKRDAEEDKRFVRGEIADELKAAVEVWLTTPTQEVQED